MAKNLVKQFLERIIGSQQGCQQDISHESGQ